MVAGISLVIVASILQGIFLLPMSRTRKWAWEQSWFAFSLTGMLVCNWVLSLISLPTPALIYAAVPCRELVVLACFGMAWGMGAVLFGLGMDILGLTLGYPLIMGLNASVGTFIPVLWLYRGTIFTGSRILIAVGTTVAISGIVACSVAGAQREQSTPQSQSVFQSGFLPGLLIACASGCLSCLPNIGLVYGTHTLQAARNLGASGTGAANAVWCIFFTFGGLVNVLYCLWLMVCRENLGLLIGLNRFANWWWALTMGAMWIGSFYLYGIGTARLGAAGTTIGWPILVSLSIGVGVLCGLGKGEWKGAPRRARTLLWSGLGLIILAVVVIPFGMSHH